MRWLPLAILAILIGCILSIGWLHTPGGRVQGPGGAPSQTQQAPLAPQPAAPENPPPAGP